MWWWWREGGRGGAVSGVRDPAEVRVMSEPSRALSMSADCTLTAQMEDEAKRVGGQRL